MAIIPMKSLLEAGVHFGHQTKRWDPRMAPYIFTARNGIYILDLQKTLKKLQEAYNETKKVVAEGGLVLFVGTKKQIQETIKQEAEKLKDITQEELKEKFKDNIEQNQNFKQEKKVKYSFKDF